MRPTLLCAFLLTAISACNNETAPVVEPKPPAEQRKSSTLPGFAVGNTAPEIEGLDLAGLPLKLSDYRGKVVVVTFWGSWCPPCCAMLPHERELVKRLEGRPFALLGVNSDRPGSNLKAFVQAERITWRNWQDGGQRGPIATFYGIRAWPTIYVLDADGVIRYKNVRGRQLDMAVDALLAKVPAAQ